MIKEDIMIGTLPIKPQESTNIGMMLAPTIMDYIGTAFDIEKNIGFNVLHSYDDKVAELEEYLEYVNESGIQYDSIFIDEEHVDELLEIVYDMYLNGYLKIKKKDILRCECGRVDMIDSPNSNAKLYSIHGEKVYCNYCGSECHKIRENVLVLEMSQQERADSIVPSFFTKEVDDFFRTFYGSDILVSKIRNTGYTLDTKYGSFNIDIDFLWMNYFKLFDKTNQIYIASNHQLFVMYLMGYIAKTTSDKRLTFIASPYLSVDLEEAKRQYELKRLKEYKALLLLYNLKWKNKNCQWSNSNAEYLTNISDTKLRNLYRTMIAMAHELETEDLSLDEMIYSALHEDTNMQNNIKTMKKLYREGRL